MPLHKEFIFQGIVAAVEDIKGPDGKVSGRSFVIMDQRENTIWRVPMDLESAKKQGERLLGLEGVEVVNNGQAAANILARKHNTPRR